MKPASDIKLFKTTALSLIALNTAALLGHANETLGTVLVIGTALSLYKAFETQGRQNRQGANIQTGITRGVTKALGLAPNTDAKWDNHYRNVINGGADYYDGIVQTTHSAIDSLVAHWNACTDLADLKERLVAFALREKREPRVMTLFGYTIHKYDNYIRTYSNTIYKMNTILNKNISALEMKAEIKAFARSTLEKKEPRLSFSEMRLLIDICNDNFATEEKREARRNRAPIFQDRTAPTPKR